MRRTFVGYFGVQGQIGTGIPIHKKPAEPPVGAVYEQLYVLYQDIQLEDMTPLRLQVLQSEREEYRKFLRGRLVTDPKKAEALLRPSFVRGL
ncbi:hypothetical protein HYT95_03600, partial [Candidatus Peregrinibacteria bacterium]|nr:hypothetical protein [Candidatus Peregrinibacteria bacterium]